MENNFIEKNSKQVTNFLPLAIISAILGCFSPCFISLILGVIAIVYAANSNSNNRNGNFVKAAKNANVAKILAFIAIAITVLNMLYVAYVFQSNPEYFEQIFEAYQQIIEEAQQQQ